MNKVNSKNPKSGNSHINNNKISNVNKNKLNEQITNQFETFENELNIKWACQGQSFTGYLTNIKSFKYKESENIDLATLLMYFVDEKGNTLKTLYHYEPYFFLIVKEEYVIDLQQLLTKKFEGKITVIEITEKVDLNMPNHLSGKLLKVLKLKFKNVSNLISVRSALNPIITKNKSRDKLLSYSDMFNNNNKFDLLENIQDIREDDVPYHVRVCIDNEIRCGGWYKVSILEHGCNLLKLIEKTTKPIINVLAFDIETTKAPLKFPDPLLDCVMMISYVFNGQGFLIVNRSVVSEDIDSFEYSPKPEFECEFTVFNEIDEKALLLKFSEHCKQLKVNVFVTFNGDFFDLPFMEERYKNYNLNMIEEIGLTNTAIQGLDKEYTGRFSTHIDCLYWVKRDSFLPQGSHGLKAVTKSKLGYNPIEVDPEDMVKFAKERPQHLCAYSVSDALSTYYIYKLMIHDFVFALCSIIPTFPDEVLRKGSGTLCEELLMAQAFRRNIIFPNKQIEEFEKFYNGHLISNDTYIGGHVECINEGVFRHDIKVKFDLDVEAYELLLDNIDDYIKFCVEVENNNSLDNVINYFEVKNQIKDKLTAIIHLLTEDNFSKNVITNEKNNETTNNKLKKVSKIVSLEEYPLIYHLDVSAMYPNIILTNRLQPVSIVNENTCSSCLYNHPANKCKKQMTWKWKGEMYPLNRNEYENLKRQFEYELLNEEYLNNKDDFNINTKAAVEDQRKKFVKRIKTYCQKTYKQIHVNKIDIKEDIVCMRENSFYVDTVRDFRDRRYEFKAKVKLFKGKLQEAKDLKNKEKIEENLNLIDLYESLQIAHKVVLNSFYGYVMRRGARWFSMEMAAMVTNTGSNIIMDSKNLVERIGTPLELDTDGIWGLLPKGFPEDFKIKLKNDKKINLNFPCTMLNHLIYDKYCNSQYQTLNQKEDLYQVSKEMSIFFEVDGPYACMVIPASKEEGKKLKKRYAVFSLNGSLKELKGFELKRRGELKIVKIFQEEVFKQFLKGNSLYDCYKACASIAEPWYKILENKGEGISDENIIEYIQETKIISKCISEYGSQKSTSLTCARRQAELLGLKDISNEKGFCVNYIISKKPEGTSVAERAIPIIIFYSDPKVRQSKLREWLKDYNLNDVDMKEVIDWDYYKDRLASNIMKIIIIPAAIQKIENPMPRITLPDWVYKMIKDRTKRQQKLNLYFEKNTQMFPTKNLNFNITFNQIEDNKLLKISEEDNDYDIDSANNNNNNNNNISSTVKIISKESSKIDYNINDNFKNWHISQKQKWSYIAKKRTEKFNINKTNNQFALTSAAKNNSSTLIYANNSKENILKTSIIKILKISDDKDIKGIVNIWIVLDNSIEKIQVKVKRKIYINTHISDLESNILRVVNNLKLPRNKPSNGIYEIEINEDEFADKYNNFHDYLLDKRVEGVYERNIPLYYKALTNLGSQFKLNSTAKPINNSNNFSTNIYDINCFEPLPSKIIDLDINNFTSIYLYHTNYASRHVYALLIDTKITRVQLHFFIVFPGFNNSSLYVNTDKYTKDFKIPNIWHIIGKTLKQDFPDFYKTFNNNYDVYTHTDIDNLSTYKNIQKLIIEVINKNKKNTEDKIANINNKKANILSNNPFTNLNVTIPPPILVLHSSKSQEIKDCLNLDSIIPVTELQLNLLDNDFPALDWIKFAVKKFSYRLVEFTGVLTLKVQLSNYCNTPICNLEGDLPITCCDIIFSRMLKDNNLISWYSDNVEPDLGGGYISEDLYADIENDIKAVYNKGLYLGYSADINIGLFSINALKTASIIQGATSEGGVNFENVRSNTINKTDIIGYSRNNVLSYKTNNNLFLGLESYLEKDEFKLGQHTFIPLKKLVDLLLNDIEDQNLVADYLIAHCYRWITTTTSKYYDSTIHRMINKLIQQNYYIFLRTIKDLGFTIIYSDITKITVFNNKSNYNEFQNSLDQLFKNISRNIFFSNIILNLNTVWKLLIYKDQFNYAGILEQGDGLEDDIDNELLDENNNDDIIYNEFINKENEKEKSKTFLSNSKSKTKNEVFTPVKNENQEYSDNAFKEELNIPNFTRKYSIDLTQYNDLSAIKQENSVLKKEYNSDIANSNIKSNGLKVLKQRKLKVINKWNIGEFLPPVLEKDFISTIVDYICKLYRYFYFKDIKLLITLKSNYNYDDIDKNFIKETFEIRKLLIKERTAFKYGQALHNSYQTREKSKMLDNQFKSFMIKSYLQSKILNTIPAILRKEEHLDLEENYNNQNVFASKTNTSKKDKYDEYNYKLENKENIEKTIKRAKLDYEEYNDDIEYSDDANFEEQEDLNNSNNSVKDYYEYNIEENKIFTKNDFEDEDYDNYNIDENDYSENNINKKINIYNSNNKLNKNFLSIKERQILEKKSLDYKNLWRFPNPLGSYLKMNNLCLEYIKVRQ